MYCFVQFFAKFPDSAFPILQKWRFFGPGLRLGGIPYSSDDPFRKKSRKKEKKMC